MTRKESDERYYRGMKYREGRIVGMNPHGDEPLPSRHQIELELAETKLKLKRLDHLPPVVPTKLDGWDMEWLRVMGVAWAGDTRG